MHSYFIKKSYFNTKYFCREKSLVLENEKKCTKLEQKLNELIYEVYELSTEEINVIEESLK